MYTLPLKTYTALTKQTIEKGRASMRVTINPTNFKKVRTFFINAKSRDIINKSKLGRYSFTEDHVESTITVQLELKPTYLLEIDASTFSESFKEGELLTEDFLTTK